MKKLKSGLCRQKFGNWEFRPSSLVLKHVPNGYEIDLEQMTTSAQTLDWIMQVGMKTWCSGEDTKQMIVALQCLIKPQMSLCPGGAAKSVNRADIPDLIRENQEFFACPAPQGIPGKR